jgi:hypothetical protein
MKSNKTISRIKVETEKHILLYPVLYTDDLYLRLKEFEIVYSMYPRASMTKEAYIRLKHALDYAEDSIRSQTGFDLA